MIRLNPSLYAIAVGAIMVCGCDDPVPAPAEKAMPATPATPAEISIAPVAPPPGSPPPPGAPTPGGVVDNTPPPAPDGPLQNLITKGNIFFYDDKGNFLATDSVDFLNRAVRSYQDTRKYKSDDSPDWPPMTDLSLLVKYKVIRAMPAAPAGQKFVLDPQTRKVVMAPL